MHSHKILFKGVPNVQTKEVLFGVQLELIKAGNMYTGKYSGFSAMDEGMLAVLLAFVTHKISELDQNRKMKLKDSKFTMTLSLISKLLESKTIFELISCVREYAAEYLGYQYAGILYYFEKSKYLYVRSK